MMACPCCSGLDYHACCQPVIEQQTPATTPLQLMRSRYTAYTQGNVDYIQQTMSGPAAKDFNNEQAKSWANSLQWLGLTVISHYLQHEHLGYVTFVAHYSLDNNDIFMCEKSEFKKIAKHWFYVDGQTIKVTKNSPCPCGSGKKFKRCCLAGPI